MGPPSLTLCPELFWNNRKSEQNTQFGIIEQGYGVGDIQRNNLDNLMSLVGIIDHVNMVWGVRGGEYGNERHRLELPAFSFSSSTPDNECKWPRSRLVRLFQVVVMQWEKSKWKSRMVSFKETMLRQTGISSRRGVDISLQHHSRLLALVK